MNRSTLPRQIGEWLIRCLFLLLPATLLTSCVEMSVGRIFPSAAVAQLMVGSTTKTDVVRWFGPPNGTLSPANSTELHFGDEATASVWHHIYGRADILGAETRQLETEFDQAGLLVNYSFTSGFAEDRTPAVARETDFDLLAARLRIIPGKTVQAEVNAAVGTNYVVLPFRQPGINQRRHYSYSEKSAKNKTLLPGQIVPKYFVKSLDIDFDAEGIVQHMTGRSNFPEDLPHK